MSLAKTLLLTMSVLQKLQRSRVRARKGRHSEVLTQVDIVFFNYRGKTFKPVVMKIN